MINQPHLVLNDPNYLNMFNTKQYVQQVHNKCCINVQLQNFQKDIFNNEKKNGCNARRKFTDEEDKVLRSAVNVFGTSNWKIISCLVPGRNPRQCRDRYTNYLAPGLVHLEWSEEEDKLLFEKYKELGPKWTKIRQCFPSRSANDIKNRYNYTVCHKYSNLLNGFADNSDAKKNSEACQTEDISNIFNDDLFDINDFFNNECLLFANEDLDQ